MNGKTDIMKIIKILTVVITFAFLIVGYGIYNLNVSYKYEVDLAETHAKISGQSNYEDIHNRGKEIVKQKKQLKVLGLVLLLILISLISLWIYKKREHKKVLPQEYSIKE